MQRALLANSEVVQSHRATRDSLSLPIICKTDAAKAFMVNPIENDFFQLDAMGKKIEATLKIF